MPSTASFLIRASILSLLITTKNVRATEPDFDKDVMPVLKSRCIRCHGSKKQESKIRLDTLSTDVVNDRAAAEYWHEVLNVLNTGEMPPEGEPQLTTAERDVLTTWVSGAVERAIAARRATDGRIVMRRLNREEYQNTMRDLLGLDMNYKRDLPPDAVSSDGFRNNGRSLGMSAIQLEYYLETARRALDRVIVEGRAPKVFEHEFKQSNVRNWLGNPERSNRLGRSQVFLGKMAKEYPEQGEFRVRVTFAAELKKDIGYPLLSVSVGYRPDTQILFRDFDVVEITQEKEQTLEFHGRLENFPLPVRGQGKFPGLVVRVRNLYDDGSPRPKKGKGEKGNPSFADEPHLPKLLIKSVEFRGPYFEQWPPKNHRRILFDSPRAQRNELAYLREVLKRFMSRAFRRPANDVEVERFVEFHNAIRPEFDTFEQTLRETLAMVLIRPDFLYLMEPAADVKRPINDWEFASRLAYFLWSTMPDKQLFELCESGQLRQPAVLDAQIERMLQDQRSRRFVNQFTEQWLKLNVTDSVAINKDFYPRFDPLIKVDMRAETQSYFAYLLDNNLSALKLLSSDFTMLNERLAKHYGITGVYGHGFRRVTLKPDDHRGGLLGQSSILMANSTGSDAHAVRRAVWIRDRLLNDPPAPPPPDVPSLEEAKPEFHKLSIREQLEIHRTREACARCHRNIDPWGIALENFDAIGHWRTEVRRKKGKRKKFETIPVVAQDKLPNGRELKGFDDLRAYLVTEKSDAFANSIVSRMLAYALGRKLELADKVAVDRLTLKLDDDDHRLRNLVKAIVESEPFQTK